MGEAAIFAMPSALREKLSKMIGMLSSSEEGDVLAAARAIGKTLGAHGMDLHAFADYVAHGEQLGSSDQIRMLAAELRGRVLEMQAAGWAVSESERKFVAELERRLDRGLRNVDWNDYAQLTALCRDVRRRTGKRG